jgi:hypothetical protein
MLVLCCAAASGARGEALVVTTPLPDGDFESGPGTWTELSNHDLGIYPLVVTTNDLPQGITPHDGTHAAWFGGFDDDDSSLQQSVTVPAILPKLGAWYWVSSGEVVCGFDVLTVRVNDTVVDTVNLCGANNTGGWTLRTVDLAAYAGQTVTLRVRVVTDSSVNSNLFADTFFFESQTEIVFADGFEG